MEETCVDENSWRGGAYFWPWRISGCALFWEAVWAKGQGSLDKASQGGREAPRRDVVRACWGEQSQQSQGLNLRGRKSPSGLGSCFNGPCSIGREGLETEWLAGGGHQDQADQGIALQHTARW